MNALVIGGTGFIGEYLCRELIKQGVKVTTVSLPDLIEEEKIVAVRYEWIDLNTDFLGLKKIMSEVDTVILAIQPDIVRMKNIISVIANFGNIKKISYLSTLLVYKDSLSIQNEDAEPDPETDYEKKKYQEEEILTEFAKKNAKQLCITRLGNVYGDVKNKGVVNNILLSLFEDKNFLINGRGGCLRDYIYVEDAGRILANLIVHKATASKEIYNVCTGVGYTINQLVQYIEEITGYKVKAVNGDDELQQKSVVGDNQKIAKIMNLESIYRLTEGLVKTYNNYLKHYKFKE